MVSNIDDNRVWQLELGGEVVAVLSEFMYEFPWHYAAIINSPKFDRFRDFFLDNDDRPWDSQEFEGLYDEISSKGDFILRYMNRNITYDSVILYQDADSVCFRCCEMKSEQLDI